MTQDVKSVFGWAVVENGAIRVKTVSDSRRAAIVNFLVTERGVIMFNNMTDGHVERIWLEQRQGAEVHLVSICIGN